MDTPDNRMSQPRKRGPPSRFDLKTPPPEPQRAEVVDIPQPPLTGIRCPGCGRDMVPRRDGVNGAKCYAHCSLCGARFVMTYANGRPATVRLVRVGDSA